MTPAEVYRAHAAVVEHDNERTKLLAWMTARLIGFSQVPDFDKAFPKPETRPADGTSDMAAVFASFGFNVRKS